MDNVVSEQHCKRFVPHGVSCNPDGVSQTECFLLAHVAHVDHVRDFAHFGQQVVFASLFELAFEFIRNIEVVLDRIFPAAGDDRDVADAGANGFLDDVLDQGLVDQWQHFLRLGFCRR